MLKPLTTPEEIAPRDAHASDRGWRRPSRTPSLAEVFGTIKTRPASWKDMFFPDIHDLPGS